MSNSPLQSVFPKYSKAAAAGQSRRTAGSRSWTYGAVFASVAAACAAASLPVFAQSPLPGSGSTMDRTIPTPSTLPPSELDLKKAVPADARPVGGADRTFEVKSITLEGNTAFDTATLLGLTPVHSGPMNIGQLRAITDAITAYYRQHGYAVAQARLPSQDVTDGQVRIVVLEGALDQLKIQSADARVQQRAEAVVQHVMQGATGAAIEQSRLARAVLLAGEMTGSQARATLSPGSTRGATNVDVQVDPSPRFSGAAVMNNDGLAATGRAQLVLAGTARSLLDVGDTLTASVMTTERGSDQYGYNLQYERFLGVGGWYGGVRAWQSVYSLGGDFAALQATGRSRAVGVYAGYALERAVTGRTRTDVRFGVNRVDLRDQSISTSSDRHANVAWADIGGDVRDELFGLVAGTRWGVTFTSGRLSYADPAEATADAASLRRAGSYNILSYALRREQALPSGFDVVGSLRGQQGSKNLDSYHKFGLGGSGAVRAFGPDAPSGDSGYIASLELGHSTPLSLWGAPAKLRVSAFYDYGWTRYNQTPLAGTTVNAATRAGYGVQASISRRMDNGREMTLRAYVARADQQASTNLASAKSRAFVELLYPF